jgi:hypothetical protein
MTRFLLLLALASLIFSCSTTKNLPELRLKEISHIIGQWDYELLDNDGNRVKGFFQVDPSSRKSVSVSGQSYFNNGDKALDVQTLRELWKGTMKHGDKPDLYILTFSTQDNPIFPSTVDKTPHEGTVLFHLIDDTMSGPFKIDVPKNGPHGTMVARKRK